MHKLGNTLDLIFTKIKSELKIITCSKHDFISDHCIVSVEVNIDKAQHQRTNKKVRYTTKLTKEVMMGNFHPTVMESGASLSEAFNQFIKEMLDRVASETNIKTINRPKHLWYSTFIRNQHKIIRNREKYGEDTDRITNGKHTK